MIESRTWVALLVVLALVTAGCTNTDTTSTTPTETTAEPTTAFTDRTEFTGTVTEVIDGDTLEIRFVSGRTETVRLLGVDTPEVHTSVSPWEFEGIPDTTHGRSWLRTWGEKASTYAERRLSGEQVRVVVDEQADRRGGYGRLLAYVYVDGTLFNEQLLREGYARFYDTTFQKRARFESTERSARVQNRGLWAFEERELTEQDSKSGRWITWKRGSAGRTTYRLVAVGPNYIRYGPNH